MGQMSEIDIEIKNSKALSYLSHCLTQNRERLNALEKKLAELSR